MTGKWEFSSGSSFSVVLCALLSASGLVGTIDGRAADKSAPRQAPKIIVNSNALPKDARGLTSFAPVVWRNGATTSPTRPPI